MLPGNTLVVVDSAAYLPAGVAEQYGVITVPLTVVVDGVEYREFEDLDAPTFYAALAAGAKVSTSQPSPGTLLGAYEEARQRGAERVVSIHIGSALSGTVNSARIAAELATIPVHVIDTGVASFVEGLCAWEAIEALAEGQSLELADAAAARVAAGAGNVFLVRGLELLRQGGRLADDGGGAPSGVPILALADGAVRPIGMAASRDQALDMLETHVRGAIEAQPGKQFRIGISNGAADELADELEARVRRLDRAEEVMQYVIGPSIGAHTGPGCTGAVFLGRPVEQRR